MMVQRVAVVGAEGRLGRHLVDALTRAGHAVTAVPRAGFDLANPDPAVITRIRPEVVINAAAWTDVDGCAGDPDRARLLNGTAAGSIAEMAHAVDALVVQISTNEVFDGRADRAYREDDPPNPVNPYGASKLLGEQAVAQASTEHLIVRTAWLFGPRGASFVTRIRRAAQAARDAERPLDVVADEWGNPTWTPDLASSIVRAVASNRRGILHLAGEPPCSRYEWAEAALRGWDLELRPVTRDGFVRASTVPRRAVLDTGLATRLGHPVMEWRSHVGDVPTAEEIRA